MYYEEKKDKYRTMLTGTPLSAEKIRLCQENLGDQWHGTSWYFLMHLIAKKFTKEKLISLNEIQNITEIYGISNWIKTTELMRILNAMKKVFKLNGLGNVHIDMNNNFIIDSPISKKEYFNLASKEYNYSLGSGLVRYYPSSRSWDSRPIPDFSERILWHYVTDIFDSPQIFSGPKNECKLDGLFIDIVERLKTSNPSYHSVKPWKDFQEKQGMEIVKNWERMFIEKKVLYPFKIEEYTYIAPCFYSKVDWNVISTSDFSEITCLLDKLRQAPAYPIAQWDEKYELAKKMQNAGAIIIIPENPTPSTPNFAYLVPRDIFEMLETKVNYNFSKNPLTDFADTSLTEDIFKTLGRARTYGEKLLPQLHDIGTDYQSRLNLEISTMEDQGEIKIESLVNPKIYQPLKSLSIIEEKDKKLIINQDYTKIFEVFSDAWNNLMNDASLSEIQIPNEDEIQRGQEVQNKIQIKKSIKELY